MQLGFPQAAGAGGLNALRLKQDADSRQRSLAARDPLMKKAHGKVRENSHKKENAVTPESERVMQLSALTVCPFIIYVVILFTTSREFYTAPVFVILAASITISVCLMEMLLVDHCTRQVLLKWKKWIGYFGALAALAGFVVGLYIHYNWMLYFHKYNNMMKYSNVAASQPALQFEDAGSLLFTEGTTIDKARAVGYRSIRTSQTLCVAPVVDGQMAPTDSITFFAVGVNCCGWRSSFHCDDASVGGTRGGLLMLEPNQLVSSVAEPLVDGHFDFQAFENAIELQKAVFAVSASKNYRLLRWVKDPTSKIDAYRKRGTEFALLSCAAYLVVASVFVAADIVKENRRQAKAAQEFMNSGENA